MNTNNQLVNAWIYLDEDEPGGTNYNSSDSCYQTLIRNNVYQPVDVLFICFVTTTPTNKSTVPVGNGSSYTIKMEDALHPEGLTNQDYMHNVIRDARKNNPDIKIAVTLNWGKSGNQISNIFSNSDYSSQQNADNFAANLMTYLKNYGLDGFDIDWESPISTQTTQEQFRLLVNAIGGQFKQETDKHYYLTLSPAEVGNLDATAVNENMDFVNLQLYSGFTSPDKFKGVTPELFAYGAKFESVSASQPAGYQTAQEAYQDNEKNYRYGIFTCWRLNSGNYEFEQTQQQLLYQLVFPTAATGQFHGDRMYGAGNQYLVPNQVVCSSEERFVLRYQSDGNLVIYDVQKNNKAIWATNTDGQAAWRTYMQSDGNFVVYSSEGHPIWASDTAGHPDSKIIMQDDGNLVIYDKNDRPIWASDT